MRPKIYTKTGDNGTTGLLGGNRVDKSDSRLEAYGTVDELNSWIGLIRSTVTDSGIRELLASIQNNLFVTGALLASDDKGKEITGKLNIVRTDIILLEKAIDNYEETLTPLQNFILPGGSQQVGYCHVARTVCRRAERRIVGLSRYVGVDETILAYMNRLSDYLFVLARKLAHDEKIDELPWMHS